MTSLRVCVSFARSRRCSQAIIALCIIAFLVTSVRIAGCKSLLRQPRIAHWFHDIQTPRSPFYALRFSSRSLTRPKTRERAETHMSSYISTDDLAALNLTTPSAMAAPSTLSKPSGAAPLLAAKEGRRSSTGTNERAEHRSEHTSNSPAPSYFNCAPSYDQDEQASKLNAGMTTEGAERRSIATDSSSSCWATSFMSSRSSGKRVMFCPLALLIQTAADGEKDPAVVHGQKTEKLSRPRITVKTYS